MRVSSYSLPRLARTLRGPGIYLRIGRYTVHLRSPLSSVAEGVALLYADYPLLDEDGFADFHVRIVRPRNPRRWIRPQVLFLFDGRPWFRPLPLRHAFPMLEWGLNWCVYHHVNQYLIIHGAVVEAGGYAAILPGGPGVGKSTLCAGLVSRGWRLLSDELVMVSTKDGRITPIPRPISLKNESIGVMRDFAPGAVFGAEVHGTEKGTIAHMKAPAESVRRWDEAPRPGWLIFPRYESGARTALARERKGAAFMKVARGTFNYFTLGLAGFRTLADLVEACPCFEFTYSDLEDAVEQFAQLEPPSALKRAASVS